MTSEQLALAGRAFGALRAETPEAWRRLLDLDLAPLPFLRASVSRMLEELPGPDGLSRTERQMLAALRRGAPTKPPPALFVAAQRQERAVFMGDWSFWGLLDGLCLAERPLVKGLDGAPFIGESGMDQAYFQSVLRLTPLGEEVVAGRADRAAHNTIDRWWGGTHLTKDALWRFDAGAQRLIAPGG